MVTNTKMLSGTPHHRWCVVTANLFMYYSSDKVVTLLGVGGYGI